MVKFQSIDLKNSEIRRLHEEVLEDFSSPQRYRAIVENAFNTIKTPPRGSSLHFKNLIELHGEDNYVFIGDVHGDYYTLLTILDHYWEAPGEPVIVFLGDYIDRGYMQVESLLFALKLKTNYPQRVILLRGNHEPPRWLKPYPHDYPIILRLKYGIEANELYEVTLDLFDELPLGVFKERLFLAVHGGPPLKVMDIGSLHEAFSYSSDEEYHKLIEDVLWSDPSDYVETYTPSPRGAGVLYGEIVSKKALSLINGRVIIRGHEAVEGLRENHSGLVITVFSSPLVYELPCGGVLVFKKQEVEGDYKLEKKCIDPFLHSHNT
jgi:protein phosphatase